MRNPLLTFCALFFFISSGPTISQNIVGTTVVDGKKAHLFSDNTWKFEEPLERNCKVVSKTIRFCGPDILWKQIDPHDKAMAAQFKRGPSLFLHFTQENLGTRKGVSVAKVRKVVVQAMAKAAGVPTTRIPVHFDIPSKVLEHESTTMAYSAHLEGYDVVYLNTIILHADWTIQIVTYEVGETAVTEKHKFHHENSLKLTKLAS